MGTLPTVAIVVYEAVLHNKNPRIPAALTDHRFAIVVAGHDHESAVGNWLRCCGLGWMKSA